ncbi:hypothetical protein ZWY2020_035883 [Hordeum vulgare]|nr:hypothetical protein ZWY2020_035883 [Hordeum vulgare]
MEAMGRKRLTQSMTMKRVAEECCAMNSKAVKRHWVVYTANGERFEVPLAYLGTAFLRELLRMSQEEFGFASGNDGMMILICDNAVAECAMCLLRRDAPMEVVMAFLCYFDSGVVASCVGLIHHVALC